MNVFTRSWHSWLSCMSPPVSSTLLLLNDSLFLQHVFGGTHHSFCPARHKPQHLSNWRAARQHFAAALSKALWLRPQWWLLDRSRCQEFLQGPCSASQVGSFLWIGASCLKHRPAVCRFHTCSSSSPGSLAQSSLEGRNCCEPFYT